MGRVEADEHGVVWLIDAEGVRYQLAVVCSGRLAHRGCVSRGAGDGGRARVREWAGAVMGHATIRASHRRAW